jgi:carboxyl-terminal processing protease
MRRHLPGRLTALTPLLALTLALAAACGDGSGSSAPSPAPSSTLPPTVAAPAATATVDAEALLRDGGVALIGQAYDRLLDEYITPLEPAVLLAEAWSGLAAAAAAQGLATPPSPGFGGDRLAAFASFRGAYVPLAAAAPDSTALRHGAIRAMAASLHDCHTFFLSPVASDTLIDTRAGRGAVGIGVELAGVPPLVTEVISTGPAARAGIAVGDRVVAVDSVDMTAQGPAAAFERINGDEGTDVRLELRRPGATAPLALTVRRERVTPPNVESRIIAGDVGYVRIRNFTDDGVAAELREALAAVDAQGAAGWIIDIRGNPGGRLDYDAINLFVREGPTVLDRGRNGVVNEVRADGSALSALKPAVVMTNNRTGSVAEVFAAALQEHGVADVVGATTNGCVGYTDVREFVDGSSLAVTTHVNLGPLTRTVLNGSGVTPDIPIPRSENDIANARDPQLDAAVAHLSGG